LKLLKILTIFDIPRLELSRRVSGQPQNLGVSLGVSWPR
jgi:hypothetical protein